jgi:hypothetical protein
MRAQRLVRQIGAAAGLLLVASVAVADDADRAISATYEATVSGSKASCQVKGSSLLDENAETFIPCAGHRIAIRPKFHDGDTYFAVVSVDELLAGEWNPLFALIAREAKLSQSQTITHEAKDVRIKMTLKLDYEGAE